MIPAIIARNSPPCISSAHFMTIIFLPIPCKISFVINSCSCAWAKSCCFLFFFFAVVFLIPWGPGWESMRRFTCCRVAVSITCLTCHGLLETITPVLDQLSTHTRETQSALSFSLYLSFSHALRPENVRMVRKVNRKLLNCLQDTKWQEIMEEPQTRTLTRTHTCTHLFLPLWRRLSDIRSLETYMS